MKVCALGKNQIALLKFLHKYPNKWHKITRRKAINAARLLMHNKAYIGVSFDCLYSRVILIKKELS